MPAAAAALAALVHFASFAWRDHPLVTDVRHFVYFAQQTAAGSLPHRDFFDNKTPLATFAGAALYRLGGWLDADPLLAIRGGYLGLAALAATLAFLVHRTLAGRRSACGVLALSFHCGFWLLGLLPAIGNVPKLVMAVCAAGSALCVHRRAWMAAGVLGGLAALDWQIGGLAVLGTLAAAGLRPAGDRGRALARAAAGAVLAGVPLLVLYASRGALGVLYRQTVEASFFRGASTRAQSALGHEWARRWEVVASGTAGHTWLLAVALAGVPLFALWLWRPRAAGTRELVTALAVYHYGILAFSFWDFQAYGDLFALLHTACFFAAVATTEIYLRLQRRRPASFLVPAAAVLAAILISRPWVDRGSLRVPGLAGGSITLGAQTAVAAQLRPLLSRPTTGVLGASELLFLTSTRARLPFVLWNPAVYGYFRQPRESRAETLSRLLSSAAVERLVCDAGYPHCAALDAYRLEERIGTAPRYAVEVYAREP